MIEEYNAMVCTKVLEVWSSIKKYHVTGSMKNIMVLEEWLLLEKYHGTNHGTGGVVVHGANIFSTARGQLKSWRGSDYVMVG